jgi:hypothetical protein
MAQFKPQVMAGQAPPKAARGGRSPFWFKSIRGLSGVAGIVPPDGVVRVIWGTVAARKLYTQKRSRL